MPRPVLLNNVDHADLKVRIAHGARFGDQVNLLPIFPTEFEAAQAEFPILFRRDAEGKLTAVALLGLDRDENLFFDGERWTTRYIPVVQQRGPFSIGLPSGESGGEPMIHVDLDDPRVGDPAGAPVFRAHGGNAPYLEAVAGVLQRLYAGIGALQPMFAAFEAHDLIAPVTLEVEVDDARRYRIPDFFTINGDRLAALDGDALATLHRADHLRLAIWAASSLRNVSRLIELKRAGVAG